MSRLISRAASASRDPTVTGPTHFRFYAGHPAIDQDGFPLGLLCVIDTGPDVDDREDRVLAPVAAFASGKVRLRAVVRRL